MLYSRKSHLRALGLAVLSALSISALPPPASAQAQPPVFSRVVVFGDSLSDDGNIANRVENRFAIRYPGQNFNYANGRFTNNGASDPASARYAGVWHEQMTNIFLRLPIAGNSLDAGTCYAFGGATTRDGTTDRTVISNPTPFGGGQITITIDNMGQQITSYLQTNTADPNALYIVWGGGNDLFDDSSAANVTATANRVAALVSRLAAVGARNFLVPNVPPLGSVPHYNGQTAQVDALNAASASYRTQLNATLDAAAASFVAQGMAVRLFRFDVYSFYRGIIDQPGYFGFSDVHNSAQGASVVADRYLFWDDLHPTAAAHYQIGAAAARVLAGGDGSVASLINVSTRAQVGTGENAVIAGFVVSGSTPKSVLVRGIGPSLAAFGLTGALANPTLTLFDATGQALGMNDDWRSSQEAAIAASGYAPTDDRESALQLSLPPGAYTVVLTGVGAVTGTALVEVYDLDSSTASTSRPVNVSTRARVLTGDNALIGGFVVAGTRSRRVIVRAMGPSLTASGVQGALADPTVAIFNASGLNIGSNDDWKSAQQAEITATPFAPGRDAEAAVVLTLAPGAYTAIVSGKSGATGVALIEVYDLD